MALQPATAAFLRYLHDNPAIRRSISAAPNRTFLYAGAIQAPSALGGSFSKPMWRELMELKTSDPQFRDKEILLEVLKRIPTPGTAYPTLMAYVEAIEPLLPWKPDQFTLWRALSGIFASNAIGKVSFYIGNGISPDQKVFAATEVTILLRNPKVDQVTKDILAYYDRCIRRGEYDIGVSLLRS